MAITYFPFNSTIVNGKPDRAANAETLALYLKTFFTDGVVLAKSDALQVYAKEGMTVQIKPGIIFLDGKIMHSNAIEEITLETASSLLHRIDRVIVRLDYVNRLMEFDILTGEPATQPIAPELTRANDIYEVCLAEIQISATATLVSQANITDTRANGDLCGIVAAAMKQIDTTTFYEQYKAQFEELISSSDDEFLAWFNEAKDLVDHNTLAGVIARTRTFSNVSVPAASFAADTTYLNYPFKAEIPLTGVTSDYVPFTCYSVAIKEAGIQMIEACDKDKLIIFSEAVPKNDFVIPAVICEEVSA